MIQPLQNPTKWGEFSTSDELLLHLDTCLKKHAIQELQERTKAANFRKVLRKKEDKRWNDMFKTTKKRSPYEGKVSEHFIKQMISIPKTEKYQVEQQCIALAYSVYSGQVYYGISGNLSSVKALHTDFNVGLFTEAHLYNNLPQAVRVAMNTQSRAIAQCAEFDAMNDAIERGEKLDNLIFAAWGSCRYDQWDPCPNCLQWISTGANGYFNKDRNMVDVISVVLWHVGA